MQDEGDREGNAFVAVDIAELRIILAQYANVADLEGTIISANLERHFAAFRRLPELRMNFQFVRNHLPGPHGLAAGAPHGLAGLSGVGNGSAALARSRRARARPDGGAAVPTLGLVARPVC